MQGGQPEQIIEVTPSDLLAARSDLSTTTEEGLKVDAVVLGCPHFSYDEFQKLAGYDLLREN